MRKIWFCCTLFVICTFLSCQDKKATGVIISSGNKPKKEQQDPFIEGNRQIVTLENEEIELFLKRYEWEPVNTGTGLRIQIVNKKEGATPKEGNTVSLKYKTFLLNGDMIYNSDELGMKNFVVDKSEEISGLHEAVKRMRKGESARLIIPAHLAYGVIGDGDRIKGHASIAMYIELIDIK